MPLRSRSMPAKYRLRSSHGDYSATARYREPPQSRTHAHPQTRSSCGYSTAEIVQIGFQDRDRCEQIVSASSDISDQGAVLCGFDINFEIANTLSEVGDQRPQLRRV